MLVIFKVVSLIYFDLKLKHIVLEMDVLVLSTTLSELRNLSIKL